MVSGGLGRPLFSPVEGQQGHSSQFHGQIDVRLAVCYGGLSRGEASMHDESLRTRYCCHRDTTVLTGQRHTWTCVTNYLAQLSVVEETVIALIMPMTQTIRTTCIHSGLYGYCCNVVSLPQDIQSLDSALPCNGQSTLIP